MRFHLQDDGIGVVTAEGELSAYNATDLGKALSEALVNSERVELDFHNVSNIDLSCLQLIYSAFLTSGDMEKDMVFGGGLPEAVEKAVRDAGYPDIAEAGSLRRGKSSGSRSKASVGGGKSGRKRRTSGGRRKAKSGKGEKL